MLSESFALFQQEGFLARSSLLAGLNALRKANVDDTNKGLFYSAFFELSIGFERLMKLVLVIDHMANNDLRPMTDQELKNKYGHKIESLYKSCAELNERLGRSTDNFYKEGCFEWDIIHFLHEFALSARYYNLSKLTNGQRTNDPLSEWWALLTSVIHSDVSQKKLGKIQSESLAYCDNFAGNSFTMMRGLDGQLMTTLDAVMYPKLVEAAAPHMVWKVFKIIRPFYFLISDVVEAAHEVEHSKGIDHPNIPYMYEFFPFLLLDRSDVIRRRKWG
ncbi:hypothetical protein [Halopseudomonas bauzanensis]|uniref:Uncharacterized protein n=1 Tax=Halopseudomonas bauzanensis TaxID=653930 RepID=A0A4U0YSJ0_9GAMM|nr:hypothetical protein [Halopseudomonas bauzanensis]TKA92033.1 hypothetical protein FA869_06435 [Halopseudomonas bauzanensis]